MKTAPTITVPEILRLFKKHFDISITSQSLYYYVRAKGFPHNTGFGRPRVWRRQPVLKWFKEQTKKFNA